MFSGYHKILFLVLILIVLISIFVLNLFTVLDSDYRNKTNDNICQQFNNQNENDFNYNLSLKLFNKRDNNVIKDLINNNGVETSFVNISDNIFIYSAFETTNNIIVLIGFAKKYKPIDEYFDNKKSYKVKDLYICGFGPKIFVKSEAVVEYLPESHAYNYSAIKVQCKRPQLFDQNLSINRVKLIEKPKLLDKTFPNNKPIESDFVFIVNNNKKYKFIYNNNSNHELDNSQESNGGTGSHRTPRPSSASPKELVVCVRPLFGNISAINLLEFIAYYRLNGINRLVFYNSINTRNTTNQMNQLFDLLSSIESVEVMPFILPNNEKSRPIIHANGQLTAIHDCLYRFSNYIQIHVDFDEYLMPFNNKSIKDYLLSQEISQSTALVVQTVVFCKEFNEQLAKRPDPMLIANFNRQKTVWPHEIRSKVIIIRAELIAQMGIHNIWQLSPFYRQQKSHPILYSSPNQILLYHYRKCCNIIQPYFENRIVSELTNIYFQTINDYIVRDEYMKPFVNRVKQFIDKYIEVIN